MLIRSYLRVGASFCLFLLLSPESPAQYALEGLDLDGEVYTWHDQALGKEQAGLVLGEYQQLQRQSRDTHQFFGTDVWTLSRIRYRGQTYDSAYLMYDLHDDLLVLKHPTQLQYHSQPIKLNQDQVEWFTLGGHTFRYYPEKVLSVAPGFFDELYVGEQFDLIVKRAKDSRAETSLIFVDNDVYIMRHQQAYHRFRRKGSVLRLFKGQKQEIRQFINKNGLRIHPENENDIILLARFCDQLLKGE